MTPFPREAYSPLSRYAPDRRAIRVDLSDNTNRRGAHPGALAAIRNAEAEDLSRYPSVYADGVREAVSRRFGIPESHITTGCGSDDLLDSIFRASGEPGEAIAFRPPTFSMVEIFARMNGMVPRVLAPDAFDDPDAIFRDPPAVLYLCRPDNPTGEVLARERIEALIEGAETTGAILLIDEAYADFADDDFLERAASTRRVVVVRTLSKAFGLAGLRIGFAVGSPQVIAEIEKSRGPYKVSRPAERAAIAAIEDREGWIPQVVAEVREERERLRSELVARGVTPLPSGANFLLLPLGKLPRGARQAGEFTAALREHGVAVRPFPGLPDIGEAVRISIGPRDEMDFFLQAFDAALDEAMA